VEYRSILKRPIETLTARHLVVVRVNAVDSEEGAWCTVLEYNVLGRLPLERHLHSTILGLPLGRACLLTLHDYDEHYVHLRWPKGLAVFPMKSARAIALYVECTLAVLFLFYHSCLFRREIDDVIVPRFSAANFRVV
jgi:hypothetical protein